MVESDLNLSQDQVKNVEQELEDEREQINEFFSYLSG